jgi:ParB-like chromosome segregation protein Spo0J
MQTISVQIDTLKEFEGNPRKGNVKALVESLEANGQYRPIVVQKSTRQILAGNHLWRAAQELGWKTIDVVELDVDDAQAKKIVAADNRLADLGVYDEQKLLDLLGEIDLVGTGYVPADVDDLLALIEEKQMPEWKVAQTTAQYENVQKRPTLEERADRYAERTIRLLMCEYPNPQYVWVIERLTELRDKFSLDSNAEAILKVISEYTGQEIPS